MPQPWNARMMRGHAFTHIHAHDVHVTAMFIIPTQPAETMNSSFFHSQSRAPGSTTHVGFFDVHQHLDDNSHLFDEMIQNTPHGAVPDIAPHQQQKAKVLFQFFDGWPMSES